MPPEDDTALAESAQENAAFASGFSDEPAKKPAKPEPEAAAPEKATAEVEVKPEYVQITRKDWEEQRAAAAKTASYDQQLSRVFGTLGNLQKLVAGFQKDPVAVTAAPTARKVEIPKEAFAEMERDFPELAKMNRAALEAALSSMQGTGANDADEGKLKKMLETIVAAGRVEDLEDAYPDWRQIVGAVDGTKEQPDPNNPFRKWLATKEPEYQARINGTENATVIQRSIALFRRETRNAPKPATEKPREATRTDRIRAAIQPRGDNAAAAPADTSEEAFAAGFAR